MNSEGHAAESPQGLAGAPRSEGYNNKDEFFERCDVPSLPSWMTPMMGEGRQLRHSGVGLSDLFLQREPANRLRKFKKRWMIRLRISVLSVVSDSDMRLVSIKYSENAGANALVATTLTSGEPIARG